MTALWGNIGRRMCRCGEGDLHLSSCLPQQFGKASAGFFCNTLHVAPTRAILSDLGCGLCFAQNALAATLKAAGSVSGNGHSGSSAVADAAATALAGAPAAGGGAQHSDGPSGQMQRTAGQGWV